MRFQPRWHFLSEWYNGRGKLVGSLGEWRNCKRVKKHQSTSREITAMTVTPPSKKEICRTMDLWENEFNVCHKYHINLKYKYWGLWESRMTRRWMNEQSEDSRMTANGCNAACGGIVEGWKHSVSVGGKRLSPTSSSSDLTLVGYLSAGPEARWLKQCTGSFQQ